MEFRRNPIATLFEPRTYGTMAPATKIAVYSILAFWTFLVIFPLYWVVITSLKIPIDVHEGPKYLPFVDFMPDLHAWRYILVTTGSETLHAYVNSLIVALASTALTIVLGIITAYALARMHYEPKLESALLFIACLIGAIFVVAYFGVNIWIVGAVATALFFLLLRAFGSAMKIKLGNNDILFWIISQRILPPVVTAIPIYLMFQQVGLLDTHAALIITYTVVNLPIAVWLIYDFIAKLPIDLEESAQIDGASRFQILFEIVLPLAKPGIAATTMLVMILAWNEYLLALFLSTIDAQTMPILVAAQNAARGTLWWYMSVVIVLMILPVVFMAIILQRFIAKGVLTGAVKG